jgi:asparagine synthase (glutamine-hydrolysing)
MEDLTSQSVVSSRGLFDAAAVAGLRRAFLDSAADAALTLFSLMAIEVWCRALDAAPTVGGVASGPSYRMAIS